MLLVVPNFRPCLLSGDGTLYSTFGVLVIWLTAASVALGAFNCRVVGGTALRVCYAMSEFVSFVGRIHRIQYV